MVVKYIYLFILIIGFTLGMPNAVIAFSIYRKSKKSRELLLFIFFYLFVIIKMFVFTFQSYLNIIRGYHSFFSEVVLEYANFVLSPCLCFFLVLFVHELLKIESRKMLNAMFGVIVLVSILSLIMPSSVTVLREKNDLVLGVGFYFSEAVFYLCLLYTLVISIVLRRRVVMKNIQKLIKHILFVSGFFFPFLAIEDIMNITAGGSFWPNGISGITIAFPLYYAAFNAIILYHGLKNHFFISFGLHDLNLSNRFIVDNGITIREREIIGLVIRGFSNQDIAKELFISTQTVKNHIYNIFQKAQVPNRMELLNRIIHG